MSGTAWSLAALKEHINSLPAEKHVLLKVVASMDRSNTIFHYHLFTARDALKGLIDEADPAGFRNMKVVLGVSGDKDVNFAYTVSEANLIACMHALRASADIFSHLINGLLLGCKFTTKACDIKNVAQALPQSELKGAVSQFLDSYWFGYVAAFINTTKHRQLVEHSVSVSFEENRVGARIGTFEYDGTTYNQAWAHDVLAGIVDAKNALVVCGRQLNQACGA